MRGIRNLPPLFLNVIPNTSAESGRERDLTSFHNACAVRSRESFAHSALVNAGVVSGIVRSLSRLRRAPDDSRYECCLQNGVAYRNSTNESVTSAPALFTTRKACRSTF